MEYIVGFFLCTLLCQKYGLKNMDLSLVELYFEKLLHEHGLFIFNFQI